MKGTMFAFLAVAMASSAFAGDYLVSTDSLNYSGTISRYATLADAQTGSNSLSSVHLSQPRDGSLWNTKNAPTSYTGAGYENDTVFLTSWWYTTDPNNGAYSGWGNPNNTDDSFIQLYNGGNGTVTSNTASWNAGFNTLTVNITGANADYNNSYARLWTGQSGSSVEDGVFVSYGINYSVSGLAATLDPSTGWMVDGTSRGIVSGSFTGIYHNIDTNVPANNGYYAFNVSLFDSGTTYGEANSANLNGAFNHGFFAAPVPEPASFAVLGLGVFALKRRKKA